MKAQFNDIFHLELFIWEDKEFIKDTHHLSRGNARRWSGKNKGDYMFLPPETLVKRLAQREKPTYPISKNEFLEAL